MVILEGITKDNRYKIKYDSYTQSYEIIKILTNRVVRRFKAKLWTKIVNHYKIFDVAVMKALHIKKG